MIVRNRDYMTEPVSGTLLLGVLNEFQKSTFKMERLKAAYENRRAILSRTRVQDVPNNRLAHGYARYISTMAAGYMIGKPVSYQSNGQESALDALNDAYNRTDVSSVDSELAKDASVFGKGVELLFSDDQARPRTAALDPLTAFVVYDDTVENKPLFGVHAVKRLSESGALDGVTVTVYTETATYELRGASVQDAAVSTLIRITPHYFGGVPMVEYWNNEDETGDFEQVESLIDAYDALESDRVNDTEQFVDALLVLSGVRMEEDDKGRTPGQQLRQDKILCLPDSEATASYLSRSLAEGDVEILKDALKSDIHKFSMVPDLTDENFAGNASGVAMRYKLMGLEQLTKIKERWFKEALKTRLRLFSAFLSVKGAPALDTDTVTITFTRSLPVNELEIAQTVQTLQGIVPSEILLSQVPFVDDAAGALKALQKEKDENTQRQQKAFGGYSDVVSAKGEESNDETNGKAE